MKRLRAILLLILLGTATPAAAQIPPEWQAAAQAVIGELERDTPQAAKPWTGAELTQGWNLARAWRRHLSEHAHRRGAGVEVLEAALRQIPEVA